uniref:Uncharacterized protein n=1 Tax=Sphaerodactylus townsendi TaxID=933632 RepID=A0ACB8EB14_9SAUR
MVEQTRVIQTLRHKKGASLLQSQTGQLCSHQQTELAQPQGKHWPLQQALDLDTRCPQDRLRQLQGREWPVGKHGPDPNLLHQCQLLQDQLSYYEEVTQQQALRLTQQQERLDQLAHRAKEKDEATLQLQEELKCGCCQAVRAEDCFAWLAQELRGPQEELAQEQHHASHCEETIQELQEQLAASHAKVLAQGLLDQEEALAALQRDLAAYKATHAYSNSSYESQVLSADTLRQRLLQMEGGSAEHQRQQQEDQTQALVQDMARLQLEDPRRQQLEAAAEWERRQLEDAERQQWVLEAELQQSQQLCAQKEQAIQKWNEALRNSPRLEMVRAHSDPQEKGKEVTQQQVEAQQLEASLQQSQRECVVLCMEAQALQHRLQESREQQQRAAQELAQQKELVALAQSSLRHAQEELSKWVAEALHHGQAGQQMEAELRGLEDRVAGTEVELEQNRGLLEDLMEELDQSQQRLQAAVCKAEQHQQTAAWLELESREEELQQQVRLLESTIEMLRAELSQQKQQEDLQKQLLWAKERASGLAQERKALQQQLQSSEHQARQQEAALSQLHTELTTAKGIVQDLKRQVASCQAGQREALRQLEERGQEVSRLQADLQLSRHKEARLEEELAACRKQTQQLRSQTQALQRQREKEVCRSEERLRELQGHTQHWQDKHRAAERARADRDEELVVLKVELATLEDKWHAAEALKEELQPEFAVPSREVETLQTTVERQHADTHHLHRASELMAASVSQWAKEQKQVKEKLGHKIQDQIKQIARLTGERE